MEISNEECIADILVKSKLAASKNEARQMIKQGGVYIDGIRIEDPFAKYDFSEKRLIKYGKRKFLYIKKG
jgi:tyrosyl-tRNA synthetase